MRNYLPRLSTKTKFITSNRLWIIDQVANEIENHQTESEISGSLTASMCADIFEELAVRAGLEFRESRRYEYGRLWEYAAMVDPQRNFPVKWSIVDGDLSISVNNFLLEASQTSEEDYSLLHQFNLHKNAEGSDRFHWGTPGNACLACAMSDLQTSLEPAVYTKHKEMVQKFENKGSLDIYRNREIKSPKRRKITLD